MNNLFLLLTVISLLGIPIFIVLALINLIRKKSAKKLFKWAGISVLIFITGLVGFSFTMEPPIAPESIELSIPDYQAEYDINVEIPINITVSPENADISSLEYIADGNTLSFFESGIITGSAEGSFDIYVQSGDIISNTLSINVINITAREEAKALELAKAEEEKRLAEEKAAKEAEQQQLAEQKAAEEAEQKRLAEEKAAEEAKQKQLAEQKAAEEAEQKRLAEQKAAEEAKQKQLAEQKAAEEAEQKRLAEQKAAEEAEQQQPTQQQVQATQESGSTNNTTSTGDSSNFNTYNNTAQQETSASYVLNTGHMKIHHPSCSSVPKIAPQNYSTSNSSLEELINQGYTTCGNCF